MDRAIQRRISEAEASGDQEKIKQAHNSASIEYAKGTGLVAGATIGTVLFPGVGTIIGGIVGAFLGNEIAKD
ncbi:MAG: hypothetical protein KBC62_00415 [Candidatus Pacebacteria bacterium]|nr:hypothetical protein [Candidatus Paceibacterota bacterium]